MSLLFGDVETSENENSGHNLPAASETAKMASNPTTTLSCESRSSGSNKNQISAGLELCMAAYEDDLNYLRLLLKFGCPVNASDYDKRTAAHICCAENLLNSALILFEFGADFTSDAVKDRCVCRRFITVGHAAVSKQV